MLEIMKYTLTKLFLSLLVGNSISYNQIFVKPHNIDYHISRGKRIFQDHGWIDLKFSAAGRKVFFYTMNGLSYNQYNLGYCIVWDIV